MLWKTKTNGAFRCVRLIGGLAFKTPYVFNYKELDFIWKRAGKPKSIRWLWKEWWELFYGGCMSNQAEVRTWREWQRTGARELSGVRLCPIRFYLPLGILVVMTKADSLPQERVNKRWDFITGGFVSLDEMQAASILMGRNADTAMPDTYGLVDGNLVVVDYGWWVPKRKNP